MIAAGVITCNVGNNFGGWSSGQRKRFRRNGSTMLKMRTTSPRRFTGTALGKVMTVCGLMLLEFETVSGCDCYAM